MSALASQLMSLLMREMEKHVVMLPTSPTFPLHSDFLLVMFIKSLHLGIQAEEEKRHHPSSSLTPNYENGDLRRHGTVAQGRLLALFSETSCMPAGQSEAASLASS